MAGFRHPNISAPTTEGQLRQVKEYLFQLTNQLNFAEKNTETEIMKLKETVAESEKSGSGAKSEREKAVDTFYTLKDLIIKSADIVNAYYDVIEKKLSGVYVAESDFGTYKKETEARFTATSENLTQNYYSTQQVDSKIDGMSSELRKDGCYIRTGWLDDNNTIAGVEIGYVSESDGGRDKKFAQFNTDELAFYDNNGSKLGWFAKMKMNIPHAKITGSLQVGGYKEETDNGIAYVWVGDN